MEKHITLVGVLNIVYRSVVILGAFVLLILAAGFNRFFDILIRHGDIRPDEVPIELLNIVPAILLVVAVVMICVSILGIIAGAGVLKKKEWARILLLVISFFNLIRIPLGTILGVYSLWVLMNDQTIKIFAPPPKQ